jgi:hypothetical protein
MGAVIRAVPSTIDDLLARARSGLHRLDPAPAFYAVRGGAILIDTRPEWQRRADGEIPGAIVIERNHLEWRCDPACPGRVTEASGHDVAWIVYCDERYSPSLAPRVPAGAGTAPGHRNDPASGPGSPTGRGGHARTTKQAAAAAAL